MSHFKAKCEIGYATDNIEAGIREDGIYIDVVSYGRQEGILLSMASANRLTDWLLCNGFGS